MKRIIIGALLGILSVHVFAAPLTYDCLFDRYVSSDGAGKDEMKMTFLVDGEKAYITSNNGSAEVLSLAHALGGMTFVEFTQTKSVQVTAIDKTGFAAHSRSTIMFDGLLPTQYYGKCVIK